MVLSQTDARRPVLVTLYVIGMIGLLMSEFMPHRMLTTIPAIAEGVYGALLIVCGIASLFLSRDAWRRYQNSDVLYFGFGCVMLFFGIGSLIDSFIS